MKAEIKNYNGRPAVMINGSVYPPMMATIRTNARDHIEFDHEYFKELGEAGIKIFFLICDTIWLKPNALQLFEDEARALLDAVPDAWIVPRIGMHPTNEWIEAHPSETLTYSDGSRPGVHLFTESYETDLPAHYSLCSDQWRHDAGEALRETWAALMQLPYADRIIGCFLAAPGVYENRHPGGFTGQREMHDSFALRNRIYIVEDDERTHLENRYFRDKYNLYDITDSVNILKREFGRNICEETQAWWFDQLLGGRRFKDPAIYELFAAQQKIAAASYEKDRRKNSEIAFIYDQESIQCVSQQTTRDLIEEMRNYTIARIGAPVDQYYHDDMANPAMPSYKLYVFFNLFYVTEEERRIIREKLKKDGATAVWMYASGVIDPDAEKRFDPANMKSLTGMEMEMLEGCWEAKLRVTEHPLTAKLDKREILGANFALLKRVCAPSTNEGGEGTYLYPLFYSRDGEVAANFLTSGVPAITVKKLDGYTSIFYGAKCIEGKILRAMAEYAGCHIYTDSEEVLFANRNYITFHASFSGTKTLRLPRRCTVREVYEDKIYATDADSVTFDAYLGETKMFELTD